MVANELFTESLSEERIAYFEKLIDNAQLKLARNPGLLSDEQKAQLMSMIHTAQKAISFRENLHCQ